MKKPNLSADLIVADVLARWPEAIPVFLGHRMGCVGCAMAAFEALREVAATYGLSPCRFVGELRENLTGGEGGYTDGEGQKAGGAACSASGKTG